MKLVCFSVDHNQKECLVTFGLPFVFAGALINLPYTKDGKSVVVVGLTPYTTEKVINIPFDRYKDADNICNWNNGNVGRMIEKLTALSN
jgi:hypothetical protein